MVNRFQVAIPPLTGRALRRAYIYLPDTYDTSTRRYPVMYMFDGHNVFFDEDATYGTSWRMGEYLSRTHKQLIVVAVECNHEGNGRLEEYSPFSFSDPGLGTITGRGKTYLHWLFHTLKPGIDAAYRTLPDRSHTLLCGSSMGGLMALYGAVAYNRYVQRAACLSPSLWTMPEQIISSIASAKLSADTCLYLDYGSRELSNHEANSAVLLAAVRQLMKKQVNVTFRVVPGGTHSEASWQKQIPVFLQCLGL